MNNNTDLYWQLLHNPQSLRQLYHCNNLDDFVALMSGFLQWPDLLVDELLNFLHQQNQQFLLPELAVFSRYWQPADYKIKDQSVKWLPAFEPLSKAFYQDDMAEQGSLLAQLIRPKSRLGDLLAQAESLTPVQPALLIFHWSRCGSTLLAGLYRQLTGVKLLSESMLISDLLSDPYWSASQKPQLLQLAIKLQGQFRHQERQLVVKCNAWDLLEWPLWLEQFPTAAVLCLGRQPEAILSSHQRMAGMHMAGRVAALWPEVVTSSEPLDLISCRIKVLERLLRASISLLQSGRASYLSYQELVLQSPQQLTAYIGREPDAAELQAWFLYLKSDAKQPGTLFQPATLSPQTAFSSAELQQIKQQLDPLYNQCSNFSSENYNPVGGLKG